MTDTEKLIILLQNPEVQKVIKAIIQNAFIETNIRLVFDLPNIDPSLAGKIAERVPS